MQLKRTHDRLESGLRDIMALATEDTGSTPLEKVASISALVKAYLSTPYDYASLPVDPTDEDRESIAPPEPTLLLLPKAALENGVSVAEIRRDIRRTDF